MKTSTDARHPLAGIGIPPVGEPMTTETRNSLLTFVRFRADNPNSDVTMHLPAQDAFLVVLSVSDLPKHDFWCRGKHEVMGSLLRSEFKIVDLNVAVACRLKGAFDNIHMHIPRAALDDIADEADSPRIAELRVQGGWKTTDPIVERIKGVVLEAFERPGDVSGLFVDHLVLALNAHIARAYGGMRDAERRWKGGLAPWQERRATEMIDANLTNQISVQQIAEECTLSPAHFSRAFKTSTGRTPHRWLQERRVDRAKTLLQTSELSLADVALACGFADQSHFTRTFTRLAGSPPGAWRRFRRAA